MVEWFRQIICEVDNATKPLLSSQRAERLWEAGARSIKDLDAMLAGSDDGLVVAACAVILHLRLTEKTSQVVDALVRFAAASNEHTAVVGLAAASLGIPGHETLLVSVFRHLVVGAPSTGIVETALGILCFLPVERSIGPDDAYVDRLLEWAGDEETSDRIRLPSIASLAPFNSAPRVAALLRGLLRDVNHDVRREARLALSADREQWHDAP